MDVDWEQRVLNFHELWHLTVQRQVLQAAGIRLSMIVHIEGQGKGREGRGSALDDVAYSLELICIEGS